LFASIFSEEVFFAREPQGISRTPEEGRAEYDSRISEFGAADLEMWFSWNDLRCSLSMPLCGAKQGHYPLTESPEAFASAGAGAGGRSSIFVSYHVSHQKGGNY
jgi:hypothetical protein